MKTHIFCLIFITLLLFKSNLSYAETITNQNDTLKIIANRAPVVFNNDTLFYLYGRLGSHNPKDRAELVSARIVNIVDNMSLIPDSLKIFAVDDGNLSIGFDDSQVIVSITRRESIGMNESMELVAQQYREKIIKAIEKDREERSFGNIMLRILLTILLLSVFVGIIWLVNYLFRLLKIKATGWVTTRASGFKIGEAEILNLPTFLKSIIFLVNLLKWVSYAIFFIIAIPLLFLIFPDTKSIAHDIFNLIWKPVKSIVIEGVDYIPKLITIIVIIVIINYLVKAIKFIADEIDSGKMVIKGFYQDWAKPTFNIVRFLLYAFMIAIIYPYLPLSDSSIFKGVSVFVGIIFSLGSTTVIGNIMSGFVITYMRSFKIGDRVKIGDVIGDVVETTSFVIRVKSLKNEIITIPNTNVLTAQTVNFSSMQADTGLILHTTVTIGYDVPWRQIHELLISAAKATKEISQDKEPYVLQKSLDDSYVCYEINAYTNNATDQMRIYSELHQNIQDNFAKANVEIMSPMYISKRNGDKSTIPQNYMNTK